MGNRWFRSLGRPGETPDLTARSRAVGEGAWRPRGLLRFILPAFLCAGLFLALFFTQLEDYYYHYDDAFITYTFARNLSKGYGIVFHPELIPTQGSSSFLYTIILAICSYLLPVDTHLIGAVLGVLCHLFFLFAVMGLLSLSDGNLTNKTKLHALIAGLFFQEPLLLSFGLESLCMNALMLYALYCIVKKQILPAMVLLSAVPLMRLDYAFYLPCFFLAACLVLRKLKSLIVLFLPALVFTLAYVAFAKLYFGAFVPHSWIAKTHFPPTISGVLSWSDLFRAYPFLLGVTLLSMGLSLAAVIQETPLFYRGRRFSQRARLVLILLGFSLVAFLHTVILQYQGAPNMPWYYVTPLIFAYSAFAVSVNQPCLRKRPVVYSLFLVLMVVCHGINGYQISRSFVSGVVNKRGHRDRREQVGLYLRDTIPGIEHKTILCFEVGKIPYFSGAKAYDLLGLVSPEGMRGLKERDVAITLRDLYPDFVVGVNMPGYFPMAFLTEPFFLSNYGRLHQIDDYIIWQKIGRK